MSIYEIMKSWILKIYIAPKYRILNCIIPSFINSRGISRAMDTKASCHRLAMGFDQIWGRWTSAASIRGKSTNNQVEIIQYLNFFVFENYYSKLFFHPIASLNFLFQFQSKPCNQKIRTIFTTASKSFEDSMGLFFCAFHGKI